MVGFSGSCSFVLTMAALTIGVLGSSSSEVDSHHSPSSLSSSYQQNNVIENEVLGNGGQDYDNDCISSSSSSLCPERHYLQSEEQGVEKAEDNMEGTKLEDASEGNPYLPYAGVWKREMNFEPRDVVADSAKKDGSTVYWVQCPEGYYIDIRHVKSEEFKVRGFAGKLRVSKEADEHDPTIRRLTWMRHVDSEPSSCPGGIDSAMARFVGSTGNILFEEGDGYLEVWERVVPWVEGREQFHIQLQSTDVATIAPISIEGDVLEGEKNWRMELRVKGERLSMELRAVRNDDGKTEGVTTGIDCRVSDAITDTEVFVADTRGKI